VVRAYEVIPDLVKLNASGVTINELKQAIEKNNRNDGAGRLVGGDEVLLVRSEGSINSLDDLRSIVVTRKDGLPVNLAVLQK
jgi:cobalt-zinc-cadmium resistance protein CzcA